MATKNTHHAACGLVNHSMAPFKSLFAVCLLAYVLSSFCEPTSIVKVSCADDDSSVHSRLSGRKRKRSVDAGDATDGQGPNRFYIPELSNCIVGHGNLDEVLQSYHTEFHDTEIDLVRVRFADSAKMDGEHSPNIWRAPPKVRNIDTPPIMPDSHTTLQVTEHVIRIDLPRAFRATHKPNHTSPIDVGHGLQKALSFYIMSTNEQKILHAIAVATQKLKEYFFQHGLVPCDTIEETSDSHLVRTCRLFFFEVDGASSLFHWYDVQEVPAGASGSESRSVFVATDISSAFSKDIDEAYVLRCLGEHILFMFKNTIMESSFADSRTNAKRTVMFHGTPFYAFLSPDSLSREALRIGATSAIEVMKEKLQHQMLGKEVEKLHGWLPKEVSRLRIEVEHERVAMLNESHAPTNTACWAQQSSEKGGTFTREYFEATDSWAYEFAPLVVDHTPFATRRRFISTIYPLSDSEHSIIALFADVFREFLLSIESAPSECTSWVFKLPAQPSDKTFTPEARGSDQKLRWNVILRYLPMTIFRTATLLRRELEKDDRFKKFERSWPKLVTLVPPAYVPDEHNPQVEMSHYASLRTGLEHLKEVQKLSRST